MNNEYNLSILEALFNDHLHAEKISRVSIKNYRSDIKYFLNWFYIYLKGQNSDITSSIEGNSYIELFILHSSKGLIEEIKSYLVTSNLPVKTINRRLSAIRRFYSFCVIRGFLGDNPAKYTSNVKFQAESQVETHKKKETNSYDSFQEYLSDSLNSKNQAQVLEDFKEFVNLWG
jgi:site-specific recombinase XerD